MNKRCTHILFTGILFILAFRESIAQSTFYTTYAHITDGGEGRNVAQANDGGYFLTWYFYNSGKFITCLTKLDCAGAKEWEKQFDCGYTTVPVDLFPQQDNGCLLILNIRRNADWETAVIRQDALGNEQWTTSVPVRMAGMVGSSTQGPDGSIYICGSGLIPASGTNGTTLAKLKPHGELEWIKKYYNLAHHTPIAITVTSENKIAITGTAGFTGQLFSDLFVMLFDKDGVFIKQKVVGTYYDDMPRSVSADEAGNIYVTGYSYFLGSAWDILFLKLDRNLDIIQSKFYDAGTAQGEQARYISCTKTGIFIFGDEGDFNGRNPAVIRVDTDGAVQWAKSYPVSPSFMNYCFQGAQCMDGGLLFTGDFRPLTQTRCTGLIKTKADGDAGCHTAPLNLISRTEVFSVRDTSLLAITTSDTANPESIPIVALPTTETSYCSSILPCGDFKKTGELCPQVCYTFSDHSLQATSWSWMFENGTPASSADQVPPQVCFSGEGIKKITLELGNINGSTVYTQYIDVTLDCIISIPNIFSPNNDDVNEVFFAKGIKDFTLQIFNRWGTIVYDADFPGKWWDGTTDNGAKAVDGLYFYILQLKEDGKTFHGTVELVR